MTRSYRKDFLRYLSPVESVPAVKKLSVWLAIASAGADPSDVRQGRSAMIGTYLTSLKTILLQASYVCGRCSTIDSASPLQRRNRRNDNYMRDLSNYDYADTDRAQYGPLAPVSREQDKGCGSEEKRPYRCLERACTAIVIADAGSRDLGLLVSIRDTSGCCCRRSSGCDRAVFDCQASGSSGNDRRRDRCDWGTDGNSGRGIVGSLN